LLERVTWWIGSVLCVLALVGVCNAAAQSTDPPPANSAMSPEASEADSLAWRLVAEGETAEWTPARPFLLDSMKAASRSALRDLRRRGFYHARLDSARLDSSRAVPRVTLYATPGPVVKIDRVQVRGLTVLDSARQQKLLETRAGQVFDPAVLEADVRALLRRYEEAGYPLAEVRVSEIGFAGTDSTRLRLALSVREGRRLRFGRVRLEGARRTDPSYAARLLNLRAGASLKGLNEGVMRQRLRETGLFESVGEPEWRIGENSSATLVVPVEEAPPGRFDLALGYLPPASEGESGRLVGSGHLQLHNLFGQGREAMLKFNRLPGSVSRVRASVRDPFLLGLPLSVEACFEGLQEDSTYGEQRYAVEVGYRLGRYLRALGTASREVTQPGRAGRQLGSDGRQRVPRATALFAGVGLNYRRLDGPARSPRSGLWGEVRIERGEKDRRLRFREGDTTLTERSTLNQNRIVAQGRFFQPTFQRQLLALGADAYALISDAYDRSDLFRLGGATSLRGYDEERFRGHAVGRAFAEYRYRIGRLTFAYLFFDLGFVARPELEGHAAGRDWHPGYGLGVQFDTNVGLINASYALNPNAKGVASGRVHVGLSFGL
jgi:outer membrane protein assembly factor BamA